MHALSSIIHHIGSILSKLPLCIALRAAVGCGLYIVKIIRVFVLIRILILILHRHGCELITYVLFKHEDHTWIAADLFRRLEKLLILAFLLEFALLIDEWLLGELVSVIGDEVVQHGLRRLSNLVIMSKTAFLQALGAESQSLKPAATENPFVRAKSELRLLGVKIAMATEWPIEKLIALEALKSLGKTENLKENFLPTH
jgi:hypothetical protein